MGILTSRWMYSRKYYTIWTCLEKCRSGLMYAQVLPELRPVFGDLKRSPNDSGCPRSWFYPSAISASEGRSVKAFVILLNQLCVWYCTWRRSGWCVRRISSPAHSERRQRPLRRIMTTSRALRDSIYLRPNRMRPSREMHVTEIVAENRIFYSLSRTGLSTTPCVVGHSPCVGAASSLIA